MVRSPLTHAKPEPILKALLARLEDQIEDASQPRTLFLSLDPDAIPSPAPADYVYVVSPAPSFSFDEGAWSGGGVNTAMIGWVCVVTIHTTINRDEAERDGEFLTNETWGVVRRWREVCAATLDHDLLDPDGSPLLGPGSLMPTDASIHRPSRREGSMQLGLFCQFDLDVDLD